MNRIGLYLRNLRISTLIFLIISFHFFLLAKTKFTLWPEMVVYPFLINNDFLIYKDIINPYPPIFTGLLAFFAKIFGYDPYPYQLLTWFTILLIDLVIFFVSLKIFQSKWLAVLSVYFFSIISIPYGVNGLWFDLVQTPLILLSFYYFYLYLKKPHPDLLFFLIFISSLAIFIKQQIAWLLIFYLFVILKRHFIVTKNILIKKPYILAPFLILFLLQMLVFWQKDILKDYLFWTVYFPLFSAKMPGYISLPTIRQLIIIVALFSLFLPVIITKNFKNNLIIATSAVLLLFAYPRFDYFHLVPLLAVISLLIGENLRVFKKSNLPVKIICVISFIYLSIFTSRYLINNWTSQVRFFEEDIKRAAKLLEKITYDDEPIYFQNSPDQLLPLANRIPPKPWADEFPWYLEINGLQDRIVDAIENQKVRYVVFKPYELKDRFEIGAYRPTKIASYIASHYSDFSQLSDTLWLKIKR